jgi:hypothetical protein
MARRTQIGQSVPPIPADSREYTYIASAITMALGILSTEAGKKAMSGLALALKEKSDKRRYHQDREIAAVRDVERFLGCLQPDFPVIVIDETLVNLDILASHPRGLVEQTPFVPSDQMIQLNGLVSLRMEQYGSLISLTIAHQRVRDMVSSALRANGLPKEFQIFQFIFATAIAHEVGGHLFVTYLTGGRPITPPEITAPGYEGQQVGGESGRFLELSLFGGNIEIYRFPNSPPEHVSHVICQFHD